MGHVPTRRDGKGELSKLSIPPSSFYPYLPLGSLKLKVPRRSRCQVESLQKLPPMYLPAFLTSFLPFFSLFLSNLSHHDDATWLRVWSALLSREKHRYSRGQCVNSSSPFSCFFSFWKGFSLRERGGGVSVRGKLEQAWQTFEQGTQGSS